MVLKNGAYINNIVWHEVIYLPITFIHLVHLYGHKSEKKHIFSFHFLLYGKPNKGKRLSQKTKEKEIHSSIFFSLLSLCPNIHKRIDFFSFLSHFFATIHFISFLFLICNQTKHKLYNLFSMCLRHDRFIFWGKDMIIYIDFFYIYIYCRVTIRGGP